MPSQRLYYNYQNERERLGLQGRFDWKPNDAVSAFVSTYYFDQSERSLRNDLNAAVQSSATVANQTARSGTLSNVTQTAQLGRYRWQRDVYGVYARAEGDLGNGWRSDVGASWSHSRVDNPQTVDAFAQGRLQYAYDTMAMCRSSRRSNPTAAGNLGLYAANLHRDERYRLNEDRYDLQANLGFNARAEDRGFGAITARASPSSGKGEPGPHQLYPCLIRWRAPPAARSAASSVIRRSPRSTRARSTPCSTRGACWCHRNHRHRRAGRRYL